VEKEMSTFAHPPEVEALLNGQSQVVVDMLHQLLDTLSDRTHNLKYSESYKVFRLIRPKDKVLTYMNMNIDKSSAFT